MTVADQNRFSLFSQIRKIREILNLIGETKCYQFIRNCTFMVKKPILMKSKLFIG